MSELETAVTPPAASAPAAPAAPTAVPSVSAVAAPATPMAAPQAPATGAPPVEPSWLKGRLEETRQAAFRQAAQQQQQLQAQYEARLQQVQQQLHALVGVTPPANPEVESVRQQFGQLYPGLTRIEERANEVLGILERAGEQESQTNHYWQSYGRQTLNRLYEQAATSLGSPLTEEGKRQLHASFTGYVASSPELTSRYANDPTLVGDFWRAFTSSFVDPVRRASSTAVVDRTATLLPSDSPGGAPRVPAPPKMEGLDERSAQAWAQYQATRKQ